MHRNLLIQFYGIHSLSSSSFESLRIISGQIFFFFLIFFVHSRLKRKISENVELPLGGKKKIARLKHYHYEDSFQACISTKLFGMFHVCVFFLIVLWRHINIVLLNMKHFKQFSWNATWKESTQQCILKNIHIILNLTKYQAYFTELLIEWIFFWFFFGWLWLAYDPNMTWCDFKFFKKKKSGPMRAWGGPGDYF